MIKANYSNRSTVVDILLKSFDKNKNVNYVVKQDLKRQDRIKSLMEYTFDSYFEKGEIYLSDENKGAMVLSFPNQHNNGLLKSIWLNLKLIIRAIGIFRVLKVLNWKNEINKHIPNISYIYLEFIGVDPLYQRKGIGGTLLAKAIKRGKELEVPIYLVTSMEENLPFYKSFNFEVIHELKLEHNIYIIRKVA